MSGESIGSGDPVVIVGAGQAGFSAAAKLREMGHGGPIALIGNEQFAPYQRPPLSKAYLLGEMAEARLYFRDPGFYTQKNIDLRLSTSVVRIDRTRRRVELSDGSILPYARLLLATGARPRPWPASVGGDLHGVYSVRALSDINRMSREFQPGRRVLIIGGGYIGLEAAAVAAKSSLSVSLVEAAPRILARVAASDTASFFRTLHRSHGVDLRENTGVERLLGEEGHVTGARLADGTELAADFVIVGIGVLPNVELAEAAGLETENGISVDVDCQTSDPAILAAGDCAVFPWRGRRIRLESVGNAIDQGEAAAKTMLGRSQGYVAAPWFWSDQFDIKLQIAGLSQGYDQVVIRGDGPVPRSHWYYRGEELLAVDALNDPRVYMAAKRMIDQGISPPREAVAHPETDLKAFLKS